MRRTALALLVLALAGCEETTITPEAAEQTPTTERPNTVRDEAARVAATAPSTTRATVPTTLPAPTEVSLGTRLTIDPGNHKVTAYTFKAPVRSTNQFNVPKAGHQFVAVDVEQCAGPGGDRFGPNSFDFQLAMPDNTRMRPANSAGLQEPKFESTPLQAGECIRGWINFEAPIDPPPRFLVYASGGASARWRLA